MTKKAIIKRRLRETGSIDNFYCIDNKITTRLGAYIHTLEKEGMKFSDKSGYLPGTKNWCYYLEQPVVKYRWEDFERDGVRYTRRVVISGSEVKKETIPAQAQNDRG